MLDEGIVQALANSAFKEQRFDFIELESGKPTVDELYAALQAVEDEGIVGITVQNQFIKKAQIEPTQLRLTGRLSPAYLHNDVDLSVRSFYSTIDQVASDLDNVRIEPLICHTDQAYMTIFFRVHKNREDKDGKEGKSDGSTSSKKYQRPSLINDYVKFMMSCSTCPYYDQIIVNKNKEIVKDGLPNCTCPECGGGLSLCKLL